MSEEYKKYIAFFGTVWMLTWFLAIWIYHWQFFLTGLFAFSIAVILKYE